MKKIRMILELDQHLIILKNFDVFNQEEIDQNLKMQGQKVKINTESLLLGEN